MIDPADSLVYGHLWATDETRELLGDPGRTRAWLRIIGELATAQGELGLIPAPAARLLPHRFEVELGAGVRSDLARRRRGDQPELALRAGELADDA